MDDKERVQRNADLIANAVLARSQLLQKLMDPRRDIDKECGYPDEPVNVETYQQLYDRFSIARRVVEVLPRESWQVQPLVYEEEGSKATPFEDAWDSVGEQLRTERTWHKEEHGSIVWEYLLRVDILSGIGQFGVVFLGIADGRTTDQPVEGVEEQVTANFVREGETWQGAEAQYYGQFGPMMSLF